MADMLVKLYQMPDPEKYYLQAKEAGVRITRALSPDFTKILDFIRKEFGEGWASETTAGLYNHPFPTCFIASKNGEIIGFADYDATARGLFGPTGVKESERGQGVGAALLMKCLEAMRDEGYSYCVIGSAGPEHFYEKCCGAVVIPGDTPNVYSRMIRG